MTLNRLFASDFLESLGAELGLEVPSDVPSKLPKGDSSSVVAETANAGELEVAGRNGQSLQTPEAHKVPQSSEVLASAKNDSGSNKNSIPGTGFSSGVDFDNYRGKGNVNRYANVSAGGRFSDLHEDNFDQEKKQVLIQSSKTHSRYDGNSPDSSSDHQEPKKKGTSNSRNQPGRSRGRSPDTDSSGGRYQTKRNKSHSRHHRRNRPPDSTDEYQSKRKRSNSRHHRGSTTPDNSSSSDSQGGFQSKSRSKRSHHHDSSKKHSEHSKRKRKHSEYSRSDHHKNYD